MEKIKPILCPQIEGGKTIDYPMPLSREAIKINELVDYCERLKKAIKYLADLSDIQFKSGEVNYNQVNQILTEKF